MNEPKTVKSLFEVGAGVEWDKFVARAVARNCSGIECLSGIPGSVGGTPVQNVGAYGQEVAETIESVLALDMKDGQIRELCNEACGFSYRTSIFNTSERGRYIILRVTYALEPGGAPRVHYADLKRYFAGRSEAPTLAETRDAVRRIRAGKGMLITPGMRIAAARGRFSRIRCFRRANLESWRRGRRPRICRFQAIRRWMRRRKFLRRGWWSTQVSARGSGSGGWAFRASMRWRS